MKLPTNIDDFDRDRDNQDCGVGGAYPSLGFQPVSEAALGNGDCYGFYWPYGREGQEPQICEMLHDDWCLEQRFSSSEVFADWLEASNEGEDEVELDDPGFTPIRFHQTRALLKDQPEQAVALLRAICQDFPDSAEYWYTLAVQLRRIGEHAESATAAIRAFASNWAFGHPPNGTLRLLKNARGKLDDPLVAHSDALTMKYGGSKENDTYHILKQCIGAYLASDTPILGLLLNQNYGYMMTTETGSFMERYQFDKTTWLAQHRQLCLTHLGDNRTLAF